MREENKKIANVLISMANRLDAQGYAAAANKIDFLIKKLAEDLADDLIEEYGQEDDVLHGDQHKLDVDDDGEITAKDLKELREKSASSKIVAKASRNRIIRKRRISRRG